ncbi:MAG: hypothetical protein IK092_03595, partial [Muribaculaceae bacterium]|nr:hypothetical protein [Muribaculaceae bacterium]
MISRLLLFLALSMTFVFGNAENVKQRVKLLERAHRYVEAAEQCRLWQAEATKLLSTPSLDSETRSLYLEEYMEALRSEANCLYMIDDYRGMEPLITKYDSLINTESPKWIKAHNYKMWGSYYYGKIGQNSDYFTWAKWCYENSLQLFEESNSAVDVSVVNQELAQLYYKAGDCEKAFDYLEKVMVTDDDAALIKSQKAMCLARIGSATGNGIYFIRALDSINAAINLIPKKQGAERAEAFRKKGKILMMQYDRIGIDNRKEALSCYKTQVEYLRSSLKTSLGSLTLSQREEYWLVLNRYLHDCFRLGNTDAEMLYDLVLLSKGYLLEFNRGKPLGNDKWKNVRSALKKDQCAVEFVEYAGKNDESRLGCLVLKTDSKSPLF